MTEKGLTLIQRVAICFVAGVIGGLAVVLFSRVLFGLGLGAAFGIKAPLSLKPRIYTGRSSGAGCGHPLRALYKGRLEAAVPLRSSLLPRSGACVIPNLPADGGQGVFRASAGRADVHSLPAAGKPAVRDNRGFGRKGDNGEEAFYSGLANRQSPERYRHIPSRAASPAGTCGLRGLPSHFVNLRKPPRPLPRRRPPSNRPQRYRAPAACSGTF